jgi:hypothetical protein
MDKRELVKVMNEELKLPGQHEKKELPAIIMKAQEVNLPP